MSSISSDYRKSKSYPDPAMALEKGFSPIDSCRCETEVFIAEKVAVLIEDFSCAFEISGFEKSQLSCFGVRISRDFAPLAYLTRVANYSRALFATSSSPTNLFITLHIQRSFSYPRRLLAGRCGFSFHSLALCRHSYPASYAWWCSPLLSSLLSTSLVTPSYQPPWTPAR